MATNSCNSTIALFFPRAEVSYIGERMDPDFKKNGLKICIFICLVYVSECVFVLLSIETYS